MNITILTLFPDMVKTVLDTSMLGRAQTAGAVNFSVRNLRDWGTGIHQNVDDSPYGGGAGMLLRVDVMDAALAELTGSKNQESGPPAGQAGIKGLRPRIILMTPQGTPFNQEKAEALASDGRDLILIAGHYEGFDERIRLLVDEEISAGDYVLTGGELPALIVTDAVTRLLPSALGSDESSKEESFSLMVSNQRVLEYPHYTRPDKYTPISKEIGEQSVPEALKSGNHGAIATWRQEQSIEKTRSKRPDLIV